jgi:hypothetical protein
MAIIEVLFVNSNKYFIKMNKILKFRPHIDLAVQTLAAFAALAGSAASLVWLERQNSTLPPCGTTLG